MKRIVLLAFVVLGLSIPVATAGAGSSVSTLGAQKAKVAVAAPLSLVGAARVGRPPIITSPYCGYECNGTTTLNGVVCNQYNYLTYYRVFGYLWQCTAYPPGWVKGWYIVG